jgi:hypothetical protein
MRVVFHAMLCIAVTIVVAGIVLGIGARRRGDEDAASAYVVALRRAPPERVSVEATIAPPVPLSPRYGAEASAAPVLTWSLEEGTDGARIELCPTNDFDEATTRRLDMAGERVQLPAPWPHGIWYWRLRGRHRAYVGDRATPTWMLYVADGAAASVDAPGAVGPFALGTSDARLHFPRAWAVGTPMPWVDLHRLDGRQASEGEGASPTE